GSLVVNPTLREMEDESDLDLIVVGTKDGLTMVEAGADQIPEDTILEALEVAQREIVKLCEAQEDLRRQAGKAKWLDLDLYGEIERDHGHTVWERIYSAGLRADARPGGRPARHADQGRRAEAVHQEGERVDLQGPRPQEDRDRQAPPRRAWHGGGSRDRDRGRRQSPRTRLRPVPARPDPDP